MLSMLLGILCAYSYWIFMINIGSRYSMLKETSLVQLEIKFKCLSVEERERGERKRGKSKTLRNSKDLGSSERGWDGVKREKKKQESKGVESTESWQYQILQKSSVIPALRRLFAFNSWQVSGEFGWEQNKATCIKWLADNSGADVSLR